MHAEPVPAGRVRWSVAAMIAACAVAMLASGGCTTHFGTPGLSTPEAPIPPPNPTDGQIANLRSIGGSAVTGKIRVVDRGDNATILVSMINVPVGAYRIVLHETPNCASPNAFSAGAAWAPPASGKRPLDLVPTQYTNSEAMVEVELRIAGLRSNGANGVAGHSVVVYAGSNVTEIRPDVPNAAMACGVFAPVQRLSF
jgi:Cu/Zn superoxide dismutase